MKSLFQKLVAFIFFCGITLFVVRYWIPSLFPEVLRESLDLHSVSLIRLWTLSVGLKIIELIFWEPQIVKDGSVLATEACFEEMEKPRPNGKALARAYQSRKAGNIPPAYPTGWYHICFSHELPKGKAKYIQYLGEHLALFRTESGKACILDAYCPHLGANLAVSGKVTGENIQCPFHGWEFGADGSCTSIPYCEQIPTGARVSSWTVSEINGAVYLHYDENQNSPSWNIPPLERIESGKFVLQHAAENHVEAHIQEIPENGSDTAHLEFLHVPMSTPFFDLTTNAFTHKWRYTPWAACEAPNEHLAKFVVGQDLQFFGWKVPFSTIDVSVTQTGPSFVVLELNHVLLGDFTIMQAVTPISPLFQKVTHSIFGRNNPFSRFVGARMLEIYSEMFERDMLIWRNKTYQHKPLLVKNDGNIMAFRRWFKQFYPSSPDSSPSMDTPLPSSDDIVKRQRSLSSSQSW